MKVEIDILNYNGADLIKKCLPSILEAAKLSKHDTEIVVVDNCSTDESESLVKKDFPGVRFYKAKENKVLCSFNEVAATSKAEVMIFLNNDLVADKGFIDPLIRMFEEKENVFLSAARVYNFDGTDIEEGVTKPFCKWGLMRGISRYPGFKNDMERTGYTFQAGFGAFDRKKFLELGGYDELYLPGILEDTDLCFRAWRKGYFSYYQPKSHIYHMGSVTFNKKFGKRKKLALSHRNTYFFIWKNISDKGILFANIFFTVPRMLYAALTLKWDIIDGFVMFLGRIGDVVKARKIEKSGRAYERSEREVLGIFSDRKT